MKRSHIDRMAQMLPKPNSAVVYCTVPDGAVLFSPARESYYGLNETGACIWEHLNPICTTVDEVCTVVENRFPDAERDRVRREVGELLDALARNGLVEPA